MIVLAPGILLVSSFSYLYIHICKIVNYPVVFPGQVPVPDIHNCQVSASAQSAKMLPVPHVFVSALLSGAQVTFLQTVCQQTLDTCSYSEALENLDA